MRIYEQYAALAELAHGEVVHARLVSEHGFEAIRLGEFRRVRFFADKGVHAFERVVLEPRNDDFRMRGEGFHHGRECVVRFGYAEQDARLGHSSPPMSAFEAGVSAARTAE